MFLVWRGRMFSNKKVLKESVIDTIIASMINLPINYVLIGLCLYVNMNALEMSLIMTAVFTGIAITRKYYVRLYFSKVEKNGET